MAKNLKFNIKNTQIAKALNLDSVKDKLEKKKAPAKKEKEPASKKQEPKTPKVEGAPAEVLEEEKEQPRVRARSKSAFAAPPTKEEEPEAVAEVVEEKAVVEEEIVEEEAPPPAIEEEVVVEEKPEEKIVEEKVQEKKPVVKQPRERLGPTGRHIKDLLPPPRKKEKAPPKETEKKAPSAPPSGDAAKRTEKPSRFKEFRDIKPTRRPQEQRGFDARDRHGYRVSDDRQQWRKRRHGKQQKKAENELLTIRPSSLHLRLPITIKDLAAEMKVKASELISKLFMQGIAVTLNDALEDETTIQLLGHEFNCEITVDTSEEERVRITDKSISEEIKESDAESLDMRAPVVTFMGHVDHGKTSLIDYIRKSNVVSGEAGAITQHIGAFRCSTAVGDIAFLDTPGHEAFTAMRARGADVTDIVVLVVAGDEGIKEQTKEALEQAKSAGKIIVVAINKCDKPNFDAETVYRQLSEQELLPEAWGGQTITVNCSAITGEGVKELLEMLALQAEVLELKANPEARARGTVLESEMHKGLGCVATVLVQNGTLRPGDPLVFGEHWGRVKTMKDEHGKDLNEAKPSTPVEITGLSGLPEAGQEFIAVASDREAREIAELRMEDWRQKRMLLTKRASLDKVMEQAKEEVKKVLHVVLRADVQGSLEALETALKKIKSSKIDLNIVSAEVGEITESDVQLASSANSVILGFHTKVESHAQDLIKELGVKVRLHDVIYHLVDDVKELMLDRLDKIAEESERGKAEVRATFKSSQVGVIAGCIVTEGTIHRNHKMRVVRDGEVIWKGGISSLKRVKEDVREVQKGVECGIVLSNFTELQEGDILEAFEITYKAQTL